MDMCVPPNTLEHYYRLLVSLVGEMKPRMLGMAAPPNLGKMGPKTIEERGKLFPISRWPQEKPKTHCRGPRAPCLNVPRVAVAPEALHI